jgi:glycosyltransferase involved in cell wall biosynthesis
MKPLISVVLPVWNGARWLTEAIDSIRRQTHDNFELVVVDDGSTDGSADIIEASARNDRRIRTFRQERNGLVAALNRGLSEAQGQLIARLDADDRAHLQRLHKQTEYLDQHHDVGLLGSWAELIDEQGSVKGFRKYRTRPESLKPLLLRTNPLLHSSIMVRQSVLHKVGFYRPAFEGAEDYDLWLRVSEIAKIANLPEYLVQYRLHTTSITHRHRVRQMFSARLAQRAAHFRQIGKYDPTSELTTAPNWRDTEVLNSPVYGDIARLFRFLELGDSVELTSLTADQFDAAALNESDIVLNHAERRMAQLALLNLLRQGAGQRVTHRIGMLWKFVRLHPPRAAQLGYKLLHRS